MADYIVPPVSDLRLINAAEKIAAAMPGGGKVDITSSTGKAVTKELIVKLTDTDSFAPFLIQQIQVGWSKKNQHNQNGNFVVLYTRNASVKFSSADPSLDYVTVEVRGQDVFEAEEVLPISKIALEAYGVGIASQPPIGGTSIDAVTTIHATILDKLTNAIATQIGEFESFVRDRHEELEKQSRDNEDRWKGRISALDKEYADKVATLDERNLALDRREAELDNKSNTHARREIRRELNERIRDRIAQFGWSKGTYRNSFPVHAVFLLPIAFAATLAWHWTISVAEQIGAGQGWGPVLAFSFLKQTFAFVGFLIFTSFYIRWLVRNHRELVEGELGLRQFQLDVERASWAAETALEWRREEGTPMPDALIQGVTRDLFKFQHRSSDPDLTAADQLASAILGTASSLNVDTGVAKIQLDRKDLRRLQKTDAKEADK